MSRACRLARSQMPPLNRRRTIHLPNNSPATMVRAAVHKPGPRAIADPKDVDPKDVDPKAEVPKAEVPAIVGQSRVGQKVAVVTKADQEIADREIADREIADREIADQEIADQEIADQEIADLKAAAPKRAMVIVGRKGAAMAAIRDRVVTEIADHRRAVQATARPKAVAPAALEGQEAAAAECAVQCPGNPEALGACPVQWPDRPATEACLRRSTRGSTNWSASSTKSSAS